MKIVIWVILSSFCGLLFAQGTNNLWLMGYQSWAGPPFGGSKIDFINNSINISYESRKINFVDCNAVISDKSGNLQFCSNGVFILNPANDTMLNGTGLNPSYYTSTHDSSGLFIPQGNLVIPFSNDSNMYYLFHQTVDDYGNSNASFFLYYSIIDMSQDSGRGAVVLKNQVLFSDSMICGRLSACKHANGRDWWIISHKNYSNLYFKFLLTPYGFLGPYVQAIGSYRDIAFSQCCFSPDGNYYAFYEPYLNDLDVLTFDRCTGDFSDLIHVDINDSAVSGGVAFSPNSKVLYLSSENYVYQFDMSSNDFENSRVTVAVYDGYYNPFPAAATNFYLAQLAADGKIYIICGNGTLDIHVIENPDSIGASCNVCQHCINLPSFNAFTIPNYPNYSLGADIGSNCDSIVSVNDELLSMSEMVLRVYPNPVSGDEISFVYSTLKDGGELLINDIYGRQIFKVNLSYWTSYVKIKNPFIIPGIYFARIKHLDNSVVSTSIIVN